MTDTAVAAPPRPLTPGVYPDIDEVDYHADPVPGGSLSSSGAQALLQCPARFRWEQQHPPRSKSHFDVGSAAHKLVLGAGPDIVSIAAADWRPKAAREARDAAYAAGQTPVLQHEYDTVTAMAAALLRHPVAAALFDPATGTPEQTLIWQCQRTGIMCRARIDWLRGPNPRLIVVDYKSSASAHPVSFAKSVANYGYHQQEDHYLDGIRTLGLGDETTPFLFVVQEKIAPYPVSVFELDRDAKRHAAHLNHKARTLYAHCVATDHWPAYSDQIELLSLPGWATRTY
jgi:hypothetical protein